MVTNTPIRIRTADGPNPIGGILVGILIFIFISFAGSRIVVAKKPKRPDLKIYEIAFVDSWNNWLSAVRPLSPVSPNYLSKSQEAWLRYEVGQKFRAFEEQQRIRAKEEQHAE